MKSPNENNILSRRKPATISSSVVRCICVTASCVVTACGLLGLGVTCFVIRLIDPLASPCPFLLGITVFGVAGLLFFISCTCLLVLCRRRDRLGRKAMLEELPVECVEEEFKATEVEDCGKDEGKEKNSIIPKGPPTTEDNFEMSQQKSEDVSLWIEQQRASEVTLDSFPLENTDGGTSREVDEDSSEEIITPL